MNPDAIQLSIVLVHFQTPQLLIDCIKSISATIRIDYEIIVVDNGPVDGLEEKCKSICTHLTWIDMGYNAGFARANNAGMRMAKGEFILLLNSDTLLHEGVIDALLPRFREDQAVACGLQLLNADGTTQISGSYFMKGGLNFLLPLPYAGAMIKQLAQAMQVAAPHAANPSTREVVDWINGAFLMIKREVLTKAGLMDEDFFLYAEETEWCSRIRKCGPLVIYGDLSITHLEGGSSAGFYGTQAKGYYSLTDKKGGQLMVSNLLRIRKQFGVHWFLLILFFYTAEFPVFIIGNLLTAPFHANKLLFWLTEPFRYFKNVCRVWLLSARIISGTPYFYKTL